MLKTARLILREFEIGDLEDFYEYAKVPGVGEMAGWPHHEDKMVTKTVLDNFIKAKNLFAIVYKKNNKVIGSIDLHEMNDLPKEMSLELGYVVSKEYWGQGIAVEAAKAVIAYGFEVLDLSDIWCGYFEGNIQSKRVQEKLGFNYSTTKMYFSKQLNKEFPSIMNVITKEEYGND